MDELRWLPPNTHSELSLPPVLQLRIDLASDRRLACSLMCSPPLRCTLSSAQEPPSPALRQVAHPQRHSSMGERRHA